MVYLGFIIINIEVLEIILDGVLGTHRIFSPMGSAYYFLIGAFEILALLVLVSVIIFWLRRNVIRLKRFWSKEMTSWPKNDGNIILYFEMVLMSLFLIMNAADSSFQEANMGNPISQWLYPLFSGNSAAVLHTIERTTWWLHICGILAFLNYLYYSKAPSYFIGFSEYILC